MLVIRGNKIKRYTQRHSKILRFLEIAGYSIMFISCFFIYILAMIFGFVLNG